MSDLHQIEKAFVDSMAAGDAWFAVDFLPVERTRADHHAAEEALSRLCIRAKNLGWTETRKPHGIEFHNVASGRPNRVEMASRRAEFQRRTSTSRPRHPADMPGTYASQRKYAPYDDMMDAFAQMMEEFYRRGGGFSPFHQYGNPAWSNAPSPRTEATPTWPCKVCSADLGPRGDNAAHAPGCPLGPATPMRGERYTDAIYDDLVRCRHCGSDLIAGDHTRDCRMRSPTKKETRAGERAAEKRGYSKDDERRAQEYIRRQQEEAARRKR